MKKKLKILHLVQFYSPAVGGMEEAVQQISEGLASLGHNVTVATSFHPSRVSEKINNVRIQQFKITGNFTNGIKGQIDEYTQFIKSNQFDVITVFAAQQWSADLFFEVMNEIRAKKIFVPTGFSGLHLTSYQTYFEKMKKWILQFNECVFLSSNYRDIEFARKQNVQNIHIIPNGASLKEFQDINIDNKNPVDFFLTVGNHTGQKGHNDVMKAYDLLKLDKSTELKIVGRKKLFDRCYLHCHLQAFLLNLKYFLLKIPKKIRVQSLSRSELLISYKGCKCFWLFSNIECSPIVLFESAAAGKPFISIDVGNSVEINTWTESGCILPTIKEVDGRSRLDFKKAIPLLQQLLEDDQKLSLLGTKGRTNWQQKYTWEHIAKMYESLYEK